MVRSEVLNLARIMARIDSNGISDTNANLLIDQAYTAVSAEIGGFQKRTHLQIAAKFYISSDMRFRMTITGTGDTLAATDIQISATELTEATGATVATALQTAIRAATGGVGTSVAWASYYFTITTLLATAQTIEPPSGTDYSDATAALFGSYTQEQDLTWVGGFPEGVTVEADLPSDFHSVGKVVYDGTELQPAPRNYFINPMASGSPSMYDIRNDHIYLYPCPSEQEVFYLEYSAANVAASTTDTAGYSIPTRYQMMLVYYTAFLLLQANHEFEKANQQLANYIREKNRFLINRFSQNTQIEESVSPYKLFKVQT